METKLKLIDRVILPSILKKEGNYSTLIINRDIQKKIELSQEELIKYKFKQIESGALLYNMPEGELDEFYYTFTDMEVSEIKEALNKLNSENKLSIELLNLYEAFTK